MKIVVPERRGRGKQICPLASDYTGFLDIDRPQNRHLSRCRVVFPYESPHAVRSYLLERRFWTATRLMGEAVLIDSQSIPISLVSMADQQFHRSIGQKNGLFRRSFSGGNENHEGLDGNPARRRDDNIKRLL